MPTTYTPTATHHASISVPSDGDDRDAGSWIPALKDVADTAEYGASLAFSLGRYQIVDLRSWAHDADEGGATSAWATITSTTPDPVSGTTITIPSGTLADGDIVRAEVTLGALDADGESYVQIIGGQGFSAARLPGSLAYIPGDSASRYGVSLHGALVAAATTSMTLFLAAAVGTSGKTLYLRGSATLRVTAYRKVLP